jgi:hypothetical protein
LDVVTLNNLCLRLLMLDPSPHPPLKPLPN